MKKSNCSDCAKFDDCKLRKSFDDCIYEPKNFVNEEKKNVFYRVPSYENFSFEKTLIQGRCLASGINPESVVCSRKRFVLVHFYLDSGFYSIIAFSDSIKELEDIASLNPRFGSSRHVFSVVNNFPSGQGLFLTNVKDNCLVNICKNVAEYLSVGEYSMLKKSYYKASAWFEKAKNSASIGAEIILNY